MTTTTKPPDPEDSDGHRITHIEYAPYKVSYKLSPDGHLHPDGHTELLDADWIEDTGHLWRCSCGEHFIDKSNARDHLDDPSVDVVDVPRDALARVVEFVDADPALDHEPDDEPVSGALDRLHEVLD